jgi:sec-independent protein translocase protein TatB
MPSFPDTAVLVILALLLFGPKKLPVLARQLGKLMADFRRASNEFRTQMEEELRISEQAERQKQIAALEASAPPAALPEAPVPAPTPGFATPAGPVADIGNAVEPDTQPLIDSPSEPYPAAAYPPGEAPAAAPVAIATSGDLSILPPATGLPIPSSAPAASAEPSSPPHAAELETETLHG